LTPHKKELLKTWIASVLWLGIIATESTDSFSSEHTSRFLYPFFHFLLGLDPFRFEIVNHYLRKTGHFVGYFTGSLILFGAWRATLPLPLSPRWAVRWAAIAFFMTALVASLDEWHQSYIPSRTGTWHDVVLDSSAALMAQVVIFLFIRWRMRRSGKS
jgi:VanZ family protein